MEEGEQLVADIDPDGFKVGNFPVRVRCFRERGRVYTEIDNNPKGFINVSNSDSQAYFRRNMTYSAPLSQIVALIDTSEGCHQEFKFRGYRAGLSNFGTWQDRDGESQEYFDGSNYGLQVCGCKATSSCRQSPVEVGCNNDAVPQIDEWQHDTGLITNTSALPIASFTYDTKYLYQGHRAKVSVGPLRCWGASTEGNAMDRGMPSMFSCYRGSLSSEQIPLEQ